MTQPLHKRIVGNCAIAPTPQISPHGTAGGLDDEENTAAEEQVRRSTEKGELPFPDMTDEQREALSGTLDFPPTGSIEYEAAKESEAGEIKS